MIYKCLEHPCYTGIETPIADCLTCWSVYFNHNRNATVTGNDMANVLYLLHQKLNGTHSTLGMTDNSTD